MLLSERIDFAAAPGRAVPSALITPSEFAALASLAQQVWELGAPREGAIVDAGSFTGASTLALAEGLSRSPLSEDERKDRIWSYDLFRVIPAVAEIYLKDEGLKTGDSFRYLYDRAIKDYSQYIRTFEGDIQTASKPADAIAILFVDILWDWDMTRQFADDFYPQLLPGRSILIHQDFVYPYYPWLVISMGLLRHSFSFACNIPWCSVVFDVTQPYKKGDLDDLRNVPGHLVLSFYDEFIDRLNGWGTGVLALGKALYLASIKSLNDASRLADEVEAKFNDEPLVMQYMPSVRRYIARTRKVGEAAPFGKSAVVQAKPASPRDFVPEADDPSGRDERP